MKILYLIAIILISLFPAKSEQVFASAKYARVNTTTNLYKSCNENQLTNIICLVEKSYFVKIISKEDNFLKVEYNGVAGFVNKNDVREITDTPNTPYPFNIKLVLGSDCNFRSTPSTKESSNNIITVLKSGEDNFKFIGRIFADEAIDFGGTTWYYVNYNGNNGYIYNQYVDSISPIHENSESYSYLQSTDTNISNPITHTPSIILIIILFLPCIFILLLLYLPSKRRHKTKTPTKPKIVDKY